MTLHITRGVLNIWKQILGTIPVYTASMAVTGLPCDNDCMNHSDESAAFDSEDPRDSSRTGDDANSPWVTEEDIKALEMERDVLGDDYEQQSLRILKENLPVVVNSIVKLARTASSETVRLNAAKYVVDRNLGKITEPDMTEEDILLKVYEGVTVD